ncbi:MAG: prepilin-type N-terminal cleavage/methylation domain-containing protein, partial [Vitreoscilla sp.]|nr:prepilin-type N-terminal cleavage/methylation domain-containing protein [Vitreoscilla sp.]
MQGRSEVATGNPSLCPSCLRSRGSIMRVQSISSRRPQGGFTLIELVMVIVIVGVLS